MSIRYFLIFLLLVVLGTGCSRRPSNRTRATSWSPPTSIPEKSLYEARRDFNTTLSYRLNANTPVPTPPAELFEIIYYEAEVGKLAAYLTPDPQDGQQHPAIIWITGGDYNTIGDVWSPAPESNDQTAAAYRQAGLVMMFPSLRGGNQNPGYREGFYGEVNDVLSARAYLQKLEYVDPARIYLGGHSSGGTLVMLVAASSNQFRAVFAFGPIDNVLGYQGNPTLKKILCPFTIYKDEEEQLRSPVRWLHSIQSPTFVFEGTVDSNDESLKQMRQQNSNNLVQFYLVSGKDHFSVLAPVNKLIAQKIRQDEGYNTNLSFTESELSK